MPPSPPAQVGLGDPAALRHAADHAAAWLRLRAPAGAARPRRSRCWWAGTTSTSCSDGAAGAMPAPVSAVITTRIKPGREDEYRALGAPHRRRPGACPGVPGLPASSRRSRACRTTGWRSCASRPRPTCRLAELAGAPELLREAADFTDEVQARIVRTGFDAMVPAAVPGKRRCRRPGSRTCWSCCCSTRWCSCSALLVQTPTADARGRPAVLAGVVRRQRGQRAAAQPAGAVGETAVFGSVAAARRMAAPAGPSLPGPHSSSPSTRFACSSSRGSPDGALGPRTPPPAPGAGGAG